MEPKDRPRRYDYVAHQMTRLLRESDNADVAFRDLIDALRSAGIAVLGAERTGELLREALDLGDAGGKPS
jgi:hypothetical protein